MRLGLLGGDDDWQESIEKVRIAEDLGFELVTSGEAWGKGTVPWLAAVALNTSEITIGTSILNVFSAPRRRWRRTSPRSRKCPVVACCSASAPPASS